MATIVVVEDVLDVAELYKTCLSAIGHTVMIATSIRCAEHLLDTHNVDVLLTDFSLPDGNALSLMEKRGCDVPKISILITGYCHKDKYKVFDAYLTKPVIHTDVCNIVENQLRKPIRKSVCHNDGIKECMV